MQRRPEQESRWLEGYRPDPLAAVRLVCFHHAGGNAAVFAGWQARLPASIEVCAVQLPGRASRLAEARFRRVEDAARTLAATLRPMFDRPFALVGYSMGALIALELARCLRETGERAPLRLIVLASPGPQARGDPLWSPDATDAEVIAQLRRIDGTPVELLEHPSFMEHWLPIFRADADMVHAYRYAPGPPLACPITVLGGLADPDISPEALRAWALETTSRTAVRMFRGNHFFLDSNLPAVLDVVAQEVLGDLRRGLPSRPPRRGVSNAPGSAEHA